MTLADVNFWVALSLSAHVHHGVCRRWFDEVVDPGGVVFCRATHQALLRLLTNAAVLAPYGNPPLTNEEAWAVYDALLNDERVELRAGEPPGIEPVWARLAVRPRAAPKLWMDAYLAAFALRDGRRLVTTDRGFEQFAELDVVLLA